MSFQAMTWAVRQELPLREKMVLMMLANRVNADTGRCDPSIQRLAIDCGMSKDSVRRALVELAKRDLIEVLRRSREGVQLPNHYRVLAGPEDGIGIGSDPEEAEGGDASLRGVVAHSEGGEAHSEGGSSTQRGGVVAVCDPNQRDKPVREPEKRRATRLPADWTLPDEWRDWAISLGHSKQTVSLEAEKFRDYWCAKSGKDATKLNWLMTWRNWMRNVRVDYRAAAAPARPKLTIADVTPALMEFAGQTERDWPRWARTVEDAAKAKMRGDPICTEYLGAANRHRAAEGLPPLTMADATPDLQRARA